MKILGGFLFEEVLAPPIVFFLMFRFCFFLFKSFNLNFVSFLHNPFAYVYYFFVKFDHNQNLRDINNKSDFKYFFSLPHNRFLFYIMFQYYLFYFNYKRKKGLVIFFKSFSNLANIAFFVKDNVCFFYIYVWNSKQNLGKSKNGK